MKKKGKEKKICPILSSGKIVPQTCIKGKCEFYYPVSYSCSVPLATLILHSLTIEDDEEEKKKKAKH